MDRNRAERFLIEHKSLIEASIDTYARILRLRTEEYESDENFTAVSEMSALRANVERMKEDLSLLYRHLR